MGQRLSVAGMASPQRLTWAASMARHVDVNTCSSHKVGVYMACQSWQLQYSPNAEEMLPSELMRAIEAHLRSQACQQGTCSCCPCWSLHSRSP